MKKLFFSAIALVAFSGVSMGKTIEKKDVADTVSCTRRSTTTCADGSSTTVISTSTVTSTGDYEVDRGKACAAAAAKAKGLSSASCG